MAADWTTALEGVAAQRGLGEAAVAGLARLLELVRDDPSAPTTVRDPAAAVDVHVADALSALVLEEVRSATAIADLGSGAGFPGLPLALALPRATVWLIESLGRKCAFLERAVAAAGATNARVVGVRIEEWPRRGLDVVAVRAVAPLGVLVEYAAPVLRRGGSLVAWKGHADPGEEAGGNAAGAQVGMALSRVVAVSPRPRAQQRRLYVYTKVEETPNRFPRRPGMARKRPLAR